MCLRVVMERTERILIVGPSWIGDMVMAQAMFKAVKARWPRAVLDVLAPEWSRSLTERMPEVTHSVSMPIKHGELAWKERCRIANMLRERSYDRAYVLPNSWKSAWIPFWAKIPHRIGWRGEWRYGLLNDIRILDKHRFPRMVDRYIALASDEVAPRERPLAFRPTLVVQPDNVARACAVHGLNPGKKPIMVLCPGAEFGASKRWPHDYYAQLAKHYLENGWQIWAMGSTKDRAITMQINQHLSGQMIDLTGNTSLAEAIDLLSLADKVVTNDSGLMHIAAALGRSLVALYGSTDPSFTPPLSDKAKVMHTTVPCRPCFKRECPLGHHACMTQLTVETIIDAVDQMGDGCAS